MYKPIPKARLDIQGFLTLTSEIRYISDFLTTVFKSRMPNMLLLVVVVRCRLVYKAFCLVMYVKGINKTFGNSET